MACKLQKEDPSAIEGTTLFSTSNCNGRPIGVYLPKTHNFTSGALDIVIWLHGYFIKGQKELLTEDNLKSAPDQKIELRQQVKDSGKDVVLVAPFFAYGDNEDSRAYWGAVNTLATKGWGETFLDELLLALKPHHKTATDLSINRLFIACHSGGGVAMRKLVDTLGKHTDKLTQCWGFDCLYSATYDRKNLPLGNDAQPALFWIRKLRGGAKFSLHIVAGAGTSDESLHLFLMGRGWVDEKGYKLSPPGQSLPTTALSVIVETTDLFTALSAGQASPDDVAVSEPDLPGPVKGDRVFVRQVAAKLATAGHGFPKGNKYHFDLARLGLAKRLKLLP